MNTQPTISRVIAATLALALAGSGAAAIAQTSARGGSSSAASTGDRQDAVQRVNDAVGVIHQMEANPTVAVHLRTAKGVYVVPEYGRAALGVGARGGAGVVLVRRGNTWSNPAFYNMGGVSLGLQAGAEGGSMAFILNNQKALDAFTQPNKFSLNADAGITLGTWSDKGIGTAGWGDITAWSGTKGLFGGGAISVTDVNYDENQTNAYYGQRVAARDVIAGKVRNPQADTLKQALASAGSGSAASSTGSSGSAGSTGSTQGTGHKSTPPDRH